MFKTVVHDAISKLDLPRAPQLACSEALHLKARTVPDPTYRLDSRLSLLIYGAFADQLAAENNQEPPSSHSEAAKDLA